VTFIQDLLTLVDFNNDEDQASNSEEIEWNDDGGGGSTDAILIKKTGSSELLLLKMMMIEVKVASLTTVVSLKYLQLKHKVNLNYYISLDYLH
jgi:hypothetical protein